MKNKQNNKIKSTRGQKTVVLHKKNYKKPNTNEKVLNSNVVATDEKKAKNKKTNNKQKIKSTGGEKIAGAKIGSKVVIEGADEAMAAMAKASDGEAANEAGANNDEAAMSEVECSGEAANDGAIEAQVEVKDALIDPDAAQERLNEAEKKDPKKKKKSFIWNLIFLIINVLFMTFVLKSLLKESAGSSLGEVIAQQGTKLYWLIGAVVCFLGLYLVSALNISVFLKNTTGKWRFWLSLKVAVLGKYYDYITPMAVGGQPSQILNLIKGGVTPGVATSIPVIKMIIQQLVHWFFVIIIYVFLVPLIPPESGLVNLLIILLKILGVVGIIITTFISMGFLFLGSSKIVGRKIAKWSIRFGYRLRIVKNYRKSYDKFMRQVVEYQSSMRYLAKNKGVLVMSIVYSVLDLLFYTSIGFFCCMAFSTTVTAEGFVPVFVIWLISIGRYMVVEQASTIMILPGGTGIKEIAFLIMYNFFFKNSNTVAWSFFSWRMFDYYLVLIIGFIYILIKFIVEMVASRKKKKMAATLQPDAGVNAAGAETNVSGADQAGDANIESDAGKAEKEIKATEVNAATDAMSMAENEIKEADDVVHVTEVGAEGAALTAEVNDKEAERKTETAGEVVSSQAPQS